MRVQKDRFAEFVDEFNKGQELKEGRKKERGKWDIYDDLVCEIVSLSKVSDINNVSDRGGFATLLRNAIIEAVHRIEELNGMDIYEFPPFVIHCDGFE